MNQRADSRNAIVILVHGLWMNGLEMFWLRRQFERQGFATARFVYPTVRDNVPLNAEALFRFARRFETGSMHFVCHSLGGLVTLDMLLRFGDALPPGRVVLLGSPVNGSQAARQLAAKPWARRLLGGSTESGLLDDHSGRWQGAREVGVIAGTRSLGLGKLWGGLAKPNDGTVAVDETRLNIEADRLHLPVTHASMLFSRQVSDAVIGFLLQGKFRDSSVPDSGVRG